MSERRSYNRVDGGLPGVELIDGSVRSEGMLRDISANGAFVYGALGIPSGRCCTLSIEVTPGEDRHEVEALVVRRDEVGCALEFQELPLTVLAKLHARMKASAA